MRVAIKNKQEAQKTLGETVNSLESLIECDVLSHDQTTLDRCFHTHILLNKKISYVISVLNDKYDNPKDMIKITNHLVNIIKKLNLTSHIERFIQISSSNVTRPISFNSIFSNIRYNYVLSHKFICEKIIRESGIKYLILRPTVLHPGDKATAFTLDQGDRIEGLITSATVGRLAIDISLDHWILPNTTIECSSIRNQLAEPYKYINSQFNVFKQDNCEAEKKREVDHVTPVRASIAFIIMCLGAAVYSSYYYIKMISTKKRYNINIYF